MAGFVDRIKIIFDVDNSPAAQGFRGIRSEIASADGALNKMKVGAKGAFDMLGQYGPQAALAAGAALVAFGVKAVGAFTDAALEAGKFADATGLSTEEASRLIEVASDLGIEAGTLEGAIRRVNGAAGTGALEQFGVEIAKTKDGAYDATGTFLNTVEAIGRITSASEREVAAKKLMGRSWAELAELTTMSADEMREAMAAVSDEQVFDDAEVQQAREFRAAMDDVKDAVDRVTLAAGKGLTPVITDLAEGVGGLSNSLSGGGMGGAVGALGDFVLPLDNVAESFKEVTTGSLTFGEGLRFATSWMPGFGEGVERLTDNNDELNGIIGYVNEALAEQQSQTEDTTEATEGAAEASAEAATKAGEYSSKIDDLVTSLEAAKTAEEELRDERKSLADANRTLEASTDGYQDSLAELNTVSADTKSTAEDVETAQRNAADAAIRLAEDYATQKQAAGDARDANTLQLEALGYLAATLDPNSPLRKELDAYIKTLQGIPTNITTTVSLTGEGVGVVVGGNDFRKGALPTGGAEMADSPLAELGVAALLDARGQQAAQPTRAQRKRAEFDREFERLKRQYEVGDLTAQEYLAALQRLGRKYRWARLSDPWMALFREIQKARADVRESNKYGEMNPTRGPGKGGMDGDDDGPGAGSVSKLPRGGSGGGGGFTVVLNAPNALVVDDKALDRFASRIEPHIAKAARRRERGQG